jgi:hypothetical protein
MKARQRLVGSVQIVKEKKEADGAAAVRVGRAVAVGAWCATSRERGTAATPGNIRL